MFTVHHHWVPLVPFIRASSRLWGEKHARQTTSQTSTIVIIVRSYSGVRFHTATTSAWIPKPFEAVRFIIATKCPPVVEAGVLSHAFTRVPNRVLTAESSATKSLAPGYFARWLQTSDVTLPSVHFTAKVGLLAEGRRGDPAFARNSGVPLGWSEAYEG
jgi:hypothetical protein